MKKGLVYVRKSIIVFLISSLVLSLVFFAIAKPKTVKAEPITVGLTLGAVVMAFLAASGVAISSSGIDENNLDSSLSTMLYGYEKSDLTYEDWVNNIGDYDGLDWLIGRDNKAGAVAIGYELMDWLSGLPSWLIGTYGLTSSGSTNIISGGNTIICNSNTYPVYSYSQVLGFSSSEVQQLTNVFTNNGDVVTMAFDGGYLGFTYNLRTQGTRLTYTFTNIQFYNSNQQPVGVASSWTVNTNSNYYPKFIFAFDSSNNPCLVFTCNTGSDSARFNIITPLANFNVINSTGGLTGTIDDEYYQDYQDAVLPDINAQTGNDDAVGVIDLGVGVSEGVVTQEQLIQNVLDSVYANELEGTWSGVYEDQKTAEEDTNAESVPSETELGSNIVVIDGLEDFFPFCIPFDLIAIFNIFDAEPVTPHWEPEISFGGIFQAETIVIDFTNFETVAIIVRAIIIIAFCIFLILKTRDLIRG